jgi:hypothetical protein
MNGYDADSLFHLDCGTSTDGRSIGGKKRQPMMPHRVTLSCSEGCMTFRHRHWRLSSLIEIAEVEEGKAEVVRERRSV